MKTTRPVSRLLPALLSLQLSAFSLAAAAAAAAAPEPVDSTLSAATVYSDRAVVTRTAALDNLTVGEHELTFENLPSALMDDSLQVNVLLGTAQATILDVNARNTFVEATPNPRVRDLEDQLKALARSQRVLDDRGAVLGQQRDYLLRIQTASTTPVSGAKDANPADVDEWAKLLAFTDAGLGKIADQVRALDVDREKLHDEQTAAEAQLNELRNGGPAVPNGGPIRPNPNRSRNVKTVTVRVAVATAGNLQLALAYGVRGASWAPSYDARLHADATNPSVELSYYGNIRQNTGEDWKDVQLTLSTARPSLGGGAPELNAWVLDMRPAPRPVRAVAVGGRGRGGGGGRAGGAAVAGMPAAAPAGSQTFNFLAEGEASGLLDLADKDATFSTASVENGVTSASYKIPVATTILSDNTPQKAGIASVRLATKLQYESTPRLLEAAFLSAYVTNTSDFPFLAGPMNTFLDGDFVATSSLKTVMPTEKFELNLGADEGIAIKRRLVNRLTEQAGFTGKYTRITYEFLDTVTNHKPAKAHVVFKELLPVARNEKIVVKLDTPAKRDVGTTDKPQGEVTREEDGKLVWRVDLNPGEKREFPLKFTVEYPNDFAITGLE
jgi:uncharacterized protein (TIGR02231 family)